MTRFSSVIMSLCDKWKLQRQSSRRVLVSENPRGAGASAPCAQHWCCADTPFPWDIFYEFQSHTLRNISVCQGTEMKPDPGETRERTCWADLSPGGAGSPDPGARLPQRPSLARTCPRCWDRAERGGGQGQQHLQTQDSRSPSPSFPRAQ